MPYAAEVTYRALLEGAEPCVLLIPGQETPEKLDHELMRTCSGLENQPTGHSYEILHVQRIHLCDTCEGTGTVRIKPKGWRKKATPPWYLYSSKPCPDCA